MKNHHPRGLLSQLGFSAIEMLLVVGLSGILLVGLTAMIDMPQQMAAREQAENPSVAAADIALDALDRDVRYGTDVRVIAETRLEIDRAAGGTVVWEIDTVRRRLERTEGATTVIILRDVDVGAFALHYESVKERGEESKPITSTGVTVATFNSFNLKPGYVLGTSTDSRVLSVYEITGFASIGEFVGAGIFLTPGALGGDQGVPTSIRARLVRGISTGDMLVSVFEANPLTRLPIRTELVATGRLYARQIPTVISQVSVPITMQRRIDPAKHYFIQFKSTSGNCAAIETKTLTIPSAAAASNCALLVTFDGGNNWAPISFVVAASQTTFGFDAVRVTVDTSVPDDADGMQAGYNKIDIAVAVAFKLSVKTPAGVETVRASFPVQNNLALVKR
jgi:hypothetical protein